MSECVLIVRLIVETNRQEALCYRLARALTYLSYLFFHLILSSLLSQRIVTKVHNTYNYVLSQMYELE